MNSATLPVLLAFGLGLLAGILLALIAVVISNRMRLIRELELSEIPPGVVAVVQALESGGVILDLSGTVVHASQGARVMGLTRGRGLASAELQAVVREARELDAPVSRAVHMSDPDPVNPQDRTLWVRAAPLGVRNMLVLADDHTEQERLAAVRRDFIANVSHELKTPVGAIGVLADAIDAAGDDTEAVRHFTEQLSHEVRRLGAMTKDFIDLSRIQAENPMANPEVVDIADVVADVVESTSVVAQARDIRISHRILDDARVLGNAHLLETALRNLVMNAINYSPEHRTVGIGVRVKGEDVEIAVTDRGIGIAAEQQPRLFERFYRVDPARSRETGGTGLGLSIVKHITQSHGGNVTVWSKPGHGSTFTIRLPALAPHAQEH